MDKYILQEQHKANNVVEWYTSHDFTHPEQHVMEERRKPATKVMQDAITMVMSIKCKKLSYTTLLLRRLPLHKSPVLCWVLCPSERNNHGRAERLSSRDEMQRFLKDVRGTDFTGCVPAATVKAFDRQTDTVRFAARNCQTKKAVLDTNVVGKEWYQDMFAISGPPRAWETMPFSWKEMWLSKWGHKCAIHQSAHWALGTRRGGRVLSTKNARSRLARKPGLPTATQRETSPTPRAKHEVQLSLFQTLLPGMQPT